MKLGQMFFAAVILAAGVTSVRGATYGLDPIHSSALFRIKHMGTAYVYGRFNAPDGTIAYDAAKPEETMFDITLKAANVDTGNPARDTQLKSPSFFNAKDFPTLTFKSTTVKKAAEGDALDVTGDLTIHGVKKSVTVHLDHTGSGDMQGKAIVGFEGTFTVNRSDFDMKEMMGPVGDDVRIMVSFEAAAK